MKKLLILSLLFVSHIGQAATKPNILWIITDDHRADSISHYNEITRGEKDSELGYVMSPNIDKLGKEGVTFTKAYCNSPACAPSRSSMVTGKYPHHNGMYGFRKAHQAADCSSKMIPEVMNAHGYQSSHFGKSGFYIFDWENFNNWLNPGHYKPFVSRRSLIESGHSDHWWNKPWGTHNGKGMVLGTEEVYYYRDGSVKRFWTVRKDQPVSDKDRATQKEVEAELDIIRSYTRSNPNLIIGGVSPNATHHTLDGAIAASFKEYLQNPKKEYHSISGETYMGPDPAKPLFIHLGFHFPHTPVLPSKEFRDHFSDKTYKVPAYSDAEAALLPQSLGELRDDMDFSKMTDAEKQQVIQDYYAFCAMGDQLIGESIDAFKKYCAEQQQEYVIVFVCGDHGWHLGEQGIEAKFGPWDKSNRGMVIVASSDKQAWPAGEVNRDFVEYVDFAPTFYDIADIPFDAHPGLDGFSLKQTFLGKAVKRDYVIGEMNQVRGARAQLRSKDFAFSMRSRPFYTKPGEGYAPGENIRWALEAPRDKVELCLYDLRNDSREQVNVANKEEYRALADFFREKLGRIVCGDMRLEADWRKENEYHISDFAKGAHDFKLRIPEGLVPSPSL